MCTAKDFTVDTCFIGNWLIAAVRFVVEFNNLGLELRLDLFVLTLPTNCTAKSERAN